MLAIEAGTGNLIRAVTGSAADVEIVLSWVDYNSSTGAIIAPNADVPNNITSAATTTIVTGATSTIRVIKALSFANRSATSTTLAVEQTDGTNVSLLINCTLLQNEALVLSESGLWVHYDANGAAYPSVGNAATQAEMEAGTATNKYVTPQGMNWHPGVAKFWVKAGVTGNVLASWNVTSLTDNGTGDITVTIGTDFSSVDYCANVSVEMTATTYAVANTRECHIRFGGQAAGTLRCDCVDNTGTNSLIKDPTAWHISGLGDQ